MLNEKRILVTGASGFIGSHIVERLQSNAVDNESLTLHALSRSRGRLDQLSSQDNFVFHTCDLLDTDALAACMKEVAPHSVFHLASAPDGPESESHAKRCISNNVIATTNLAYAFGASANPEGFIYGDTTKVYGTALPPYRSDLLPKPNSSYGITKSAGWDFVKLAAAHAGFSALAIRPTLIYGSRQPKNLISTIIEAAQSGQAEFHIQGGRQTRTPLHINDAVDAFLLAGEEVHRLNSRVINIGGGEELTVVEIAQNVVKSIETDMRIMCDDSMRETDVLRSYVDLSEAKAMLGWSPNVQFLPGLVACREEFLNPVS